MMSASGEKQRTYLRGARIASKAFGIQGHQNVPRRTSVDASALSQPVL